MEVFFSIFSLCFFTKLQLKIEQKMKNRPHERRERTRPRNVDSIRSLSLFLKVDHIPVIVLFAAVALYVLTGEHRQIPPHVGGQIHLLHLLRIHPEHRTFIGFAHQFAGEICGLIEVGEVTIS